MLSVNYPIAITVPAFRVPGMVFRFGFNLKTAAALATAASNLPQKNPNPLPKQSYA